MEGLKDIQVVGIRHPDLASMDRRVWKPMYRRLCLLARLKGPPFARMLPGMGFSSFDGKEFRRFGQVCFEFDDKQTADSFIDRIKTIKGLRFRTAPKDRWFAELGCFSREKWKD